MIQVLVIDGNDSFRTEVVDHFNGLGGFEVVGASSAEAGLETYDERGSFDLVIISVVAENASPDVVLRLRRRNLAVPVLVVAAEDDADVSSVLQNLSLLRILEQPVGAEELQRAADRLLQEARALGFQGHLQRISIIDVIQLFCTTGKTGRLDVMHWGRRGHIYFSNGRLIHAVQAELEGAEAFYRLAGWDSGSFRTEFGVLPAIDTLSNESLHGLLIEALRRQDEATRDQKDAPQLTRVENPETVRREGSDSRAFELLDAGERTRRMPVLLPLVVKDLLAVDGVEGLLVVNRSGTILQSEGIDDAEESLGTLATFVASSCESAARPMVADRFSTAVLVEHSQRKLLVVNTRNFFIAFIGSPRTKVDTFKREVLDAVRKAAVPRQKRRGRTPASVGAGDSKGNGS